MDNMIVSNSKQQKQRLELWWRRYVGIFAALRYIASSVVMAEGKRPELSDFPSLYLHVSTHRYGTDKRKSHLRSHQHQPL